jgi:signal recognition particle GTPase
MQVNDVNAFLKRFKEARKMMKKFSKMGPGALKGMMRGF